MSAPDQCFIDTNVVVYAYDRHEPHKRETARQILRRGIKDENIVLSPQVLSEFFVVVTKKIKDPLESFADPAQRRNWIENKHMQVFPLFSDTCPETIIDVFVTEPFIFDEEYQGTDRYTLQPGVVVRTVTPETLISMKRIADRDRDRDDIKHLQWIIEERLKEKDDD